MKQISLFAIIIYSQLGFAQIEKEWMGVWFSKKIVCPFGCSQLMRDLFEKSKNKKFQFVADTMIDASGMSADCILPAKPDYTGLKKVKAEEYLLQHSQNEQALAKPKIKNKLPKILGLKSDQKVTAGLIHCLDADGNLMASGQNIIFVDATKAFARFEENTYWELSR